MNDPAKPDVRGLTSRPRIGPMSSDRCGYETRAKPHQPATNAETPRAVATYAIAQALPRAGFCSRDQNFGETFRETTRIQ